MKTKKKKKVNRAEMAEARGDARFQAGDYRGALESYRLSESANPNNNRIYDKLIKTHEKVTSEWRDVDFSESLAWTMRKQELENPRLKRVHAQMEPEWKEVTALIRQMMLEGNETSETEIIEKIVSYSDKALYPLMETLLALKAVQKKILDKKKMS